jgi:hydrogenase maturation protease
MEKVVVDYLTKQHQITVKQIKEVDIKEIALVSFKRDIKNGPKV